MKKSTEMRKSAFPSIRSAPNRSRTDGLTLRSLGKLFALRVINLRDMPALSADTRFLNKHFACAAKHPQIVSHFDTVFR